MSCPGLMQQIGLSIESNPIGLRKAIFNSRSMRQNTALRRWPHLLMTTCTAAHERNRMAVYSESILYSSGCATSQLGISLHQRREQI